MNPAPISQKHKPRTSSRSGHARWLAERASAAALLPLTLWFTASIIAQSGNDHAAFVMWLETPLAAGLTILMLLALFYHTALGLEVVIEDYVHSGMEKAAVVLVRLVCFALAAAGIIAILRIALQD